MPILGPIKRGDLIYYLKRLRFEGPFGGSDHQIMLRGSDRVLVPNPHLGDISKGLLLKILRRAHITREEWEKL